MVFESYQLDKIVMNKINAIAELNTNGKYASIKTIQT